MERNIVTTDGVTGRYSSVDGCITWPDGVKEKVLDTQLATMRIGGKIHNHTMLVQAGLRHTRFVFYREPRLALDQR